MATLVLIILSLLAAAGVLLLCDPPVPARFTPRPPGSRLLPSRQRATRVLSGAAAPHPTPLPGTWPEASSPASRTLTRTLTPSPAPLTGRSTSRVPTAGSPRFPANRLFTYSFHRPAYPGSRRRSPLFTYSPKGPGAPRHLAPLLSYSRAPHPSAPLFTYWPAPSVAPNLLATLFSYSRNRPIAPDFRAPLFTHSHSRPATPRFLATLFTYSRNRTRAPRLSVPLFTCWPQPTGALSRRAQAGSPRPALAPISSLPSRHRPAHEKTGATRPRLCSISD